MSETTPLDQAHAAMQAAPEDDGVRLRFYERLADSELFMMLSQEADGDRISPELFETPEGRFVLVFDREDRLAQFAGRAVPYAGLAGRGVVEMLAGQGIGLGVNLEVAPSSTLLAAQAVTWLHETLQNVPDQVEAAIQELLPPGGLPEVLLGALDAKLATAAGLAASAYLVSLRYQGGGAGAFAGLCRCQARGRRCPGQGGWRGTDLFGDCRRGPGCGVLRRVGSDGGPAGTGWVAV